MNKTIFCLMLGFVMAGCPEAGTVTGFDGGSHDLASSPRGFGNVTLTSFSYMAFGVPVQSATASAGFGGPGMAPDCMNQTFGACQFSSCQLPLSNPDGGTPHYPDAGNITIAGGTKMVSLTPKADGSYTPYVDTMNVLWSGGETLNIAATGNLIPAFSTTITAPVVAQLTTPAPPAQGARLMVNRGMDLVLKWTGGQGDSIEAVLSTPVASGKALAVTCTFPAGDTMGTIPAAALMNLQAGNGSFTVYGGSVKTMPASEYDLNISALSLMHDANGRTASYGATYQ